MLKQQFHRLTTVLVIVLLALGSVTNAQAMTVTRTGHPSGVDLVAQGKLYYVSPSGNDANPGTEAQPFRTINTAASVAVAGDTVLIRAGTYYELVKPVNSGSSGNYIVYKNYGDGEVIIDAQNGARTACIEVSNKSFLKFIGLTVRGANGSSGSRAGIAITNGSNNIIVDNITTYDNYFGITASGKASPVSFITVSNSKTFNPATLVGNRHYGIFFYMKVYDSRILNNRTAYSGPVKLSFGIEIGTDYPGVQADGPRRIVVAGNESDHNESQGIRTWNAVGVLISNNYTHHNGATGIQIENGSADIVIENNLSEYNAQSYEYETGAWVDDAKNVVVRNNTFRNNKIGLNVSYSERVVVHNNLIYSNNRGAVNLINASGLIVGNVSNVYITHNTFYKNVAAGMSKGGVNFKSTCSQVVFKNNIVSDSAGKYELTQNSCAITSDYNAFTNSRAVSVSWNGSTTTWSSYLSKSGQDAHSLTQQPAFVNATNSDLRLQSTSPQVGKGTILARTLSAGSGTTIPVDNAGYFSDGFGMGQGDTIIVGTSRVSIKSVNYAANTITIDRSITWKSGDAVSFPFAGSSPDMGVYSSSSTPSTSPATATPFTPVATSTSGPTTIPATVPAGQNGLDIRISNGKDDVEEFASGVMYINSSDLEMVYTDSNQIIGLRFTGVKLPPGAVITNAYIQFQSDEIGSEVTSLKFQAQAEANAPAFSTTKNNLSTRARTANAVNWSPKAWTQAGAIGSDQRTPNLAPVIQEVISQPGWASGNALVILITGSGKRVAKAYEGNAAGAPLLHIEFTVGPVTQIQRPTLTATITPTATATSTLLPTAMFTATATLPPATFTAEPTFTPEPQATATSEPTALPTETPTTVSEPPATSTPEATPTTGG